MRPHYSRFSRENATPSIGISLLGYYTDYKEVPHHPPPPPKGRVPASLPHLACSRHSDREERSEMQNGRKEITCSSYPSFKLTCAPEFSTKSSTSKPCAVSTF